MHLPFHSGLFIWGVSVLLFLPQCEDESTNPSNGCTEMGCSDGYALILQPTNTRFQEGTYEISIVTESMGTYSCFFRVSNDPTECASGHCIAEENCNAVYTVGYTHPDRISIHYPVITGSIYVKIRRNNDTLIQTTFHPVYKFIQPNGPGCPPICKVGKNIIFVD